LRVRATVADLAPIAGKLATFIRLFASDKDGEVVAAVHALIRALQNAGSDLHELAELVEHANGELSDAEMKKIFDAGIAVGLKQAKQEARINGGTFPPAHEMALWCRQHDQQLREKELRFVNDMAARSPQRALTQRQEEWLRAIFLRTGGPML
jgi:hypothetical protein